ncbi:kinase domain protein [Ceratobasidium sp. AG-Ba]|nr:kinase domain protein [Ceratobasidium sp. AG-Ba]QRW08655.1 kinase domain protein [Ceratobasidium sp. AG-Ba]
MDDPKDNIELNCLLLGDGLPKTFTIQTTRRHSIADMLRDIATYCHETQNTTLLAKPFTDTGSANTFIQPTKPLASLRFVPTKTVGDYWPDVIDHQQVHVLAYAQVLLSLGDLHNRLDQTLSLIPNQVSARCQSQPRPIRFIRSGPVIDLAAYSSKLTGHTIDTAGDPVELYHPAFSAFLQNLSSPDRPDAETNNKFLDYRSNLLWSPLEDINHASMTLADLFVLIGETFSGIKKSDKSFESAITEEGGACCIAIQSRHGFGPNGEDPVVLAALAYAKYWTSRKVKGVFDTSCCPTLIVVTAGPWVCVFGGIFLAQPVVQRFTDMIQVSHNPSRPDDLGQLVRLFHSIAIATQTLRSFYLDSNYSRLDPSTRPFPYCTSYLDHDGHKVDFKYIKRLGSGEHFSTSRVFLAKTLDSSNPKPIVVKFVERYNGQAHRLLAEQDLAPQLLYDGTTH